MQTSSNKGFTLIELLMGMIISTILLGVAFISFENASKSYSDDKVRVDAGQSLTAVLDLIGTDIKQAGEQITNASFPTVKIVSGNQITIRKALTEALPLCQSIVITDALLTTDDTAANVLVSDNSIPTTTTAGCSAVTPPALPGMIELDWQTERTGKTAATATAEGIPDRSSLVGDRNVPANSNYIGRVALVKTNGQTKILDYNTEVRDASYSTNKKYSLSLKNAKQRDVNNNLVSPPAIENPVTTAAVDYTAGDSVYLIEERTYRYDAVNGTLLLRVNGGREQTLVTGLEIPNASNSYRQGFSVAANVTPATGAVVPETTFPNPTSTNINWKRIVGVNVSLKLKKPSSCISNDINGCKNEDFETSGTFYPRNVMSK